MKLLIGGSPCTHWSIARTKNRETTAEGIGWELFRNYMIARNKYQPDYFLYENNKSMSTAIRTQITAELGVEPVLINSALVSAQNRQRLYWAGKRNPDGTYSQVQVEQPEDRGILLRDILESGLPLREKGYALLSTTGGTTAEDMFSRHQRNGAAEPVRIGTIENDAKNQTFDSQQYCVYSPDAKSVTLCGNGGGLGAKTGLYAAPIKEEKVGIYPNGNGELTQCQSKRIYSVDAKGRVLNAGPGGLGVQTGLYAVPVPEPVNTTAEGKAQCLRATCYKDGIRNMVGNDVDKRTCVAIPVPAAGRIVGRRINDQGHRNDYNEAIPRWQRFEVNDDPQKTNCLSTVQKDNMVAEPADITADGKQMPVYGVRGGRITIKSKEYPIKLADGYYIIRKLTVTECKRLQTVPDTYAFPVSDTQAYKMLGNGWTVDVIAHIMSHFTGLTEEPVEVLSMYDGMSCGHIALDKLGVDVSAYYATEIDKYAIETTQHNYPDTIQLGDAFQVRDPGWALPREAST